MSVSQIGPYLYLASHFSMQIGHDGTLCKERSPENVCDPDFFSGTARPRGTWFWSKDTNNVDRLPVLSRPGRRGRGNYSTIGTGTFSTQIILLPSHLKKRFGSKHRAFALSLNVLQTLLTDSPSIRSLVFSVARPKLRYRRRHHGRRRDGNRGCRAKAQVDGACRATLLQQVGACHFPSHACARHAEAEKLTCRSSYNHHGERRSSVPMPSRQPP